MFSFPFHNTENSGMRDKLRTNQGHHELKAYASKVNDTAQHGSVSTNSNNGSNRRTRLVVNQHSVQINIQLSPTLGSHCDQAGAREWRVLY